eukprot:764312-Hanusia_phi.AAC.1
MSPLLSASSNRDPLHEHCTRYSLLQPHLPRHEGGVQDLDFPEALCKRNDLLLELSPRGHKGLVLLVLADCGQIPRGPQDALGELQVGVPETDNLRERVAVGGREAAGVLLLALEDEGGEEKVLDC